MKPPNTIKQLKCNKQVWEIFWKFLLFPIFSKEAIRPKKLKINDSIENSSHILEEEALGHFSS